jgi:hypothetical protein
MQSFKPGDLVIFDKDPSPLFQVGVRYKVLEIDSYGHPIIPTIEGVLVTLCDSYHYVRKIDKAKLHKHRLARQGQL